MANGKTILFVVHGPGRGRPRVFLESLYEDVTQRPELRARTRVHATGEPPPPLDGLKAVVFILSDPLKHHPECEAEALALSAAARQAGIRVVNPPEAFDNTIKSRQARIWQKAGIPSAAGVPAPDAETLREVIEQITYPAIIRFDEEHLQQGLFVCPDKAVALKFLPQVRFPAVALQFIDTRPSWRRVDPHGVMARYFHKKRSMVFPNAVFNNHLFFSSVPIVARSTCTFKEAIDGKPRPDLHEMIDADIGYSLSPPEQPELMQAAVRALGLDFAAVDYSTFGDGRVVLWEANPHFALPHWSKVTLLGGPRRLKDRNPRYTAALADYFAQLAGVAEPVA